MMMQMARRSKQDWLMEGAKALAELGAAALTIDGLTARLGVTKGSFYHHFGCLQGYIDALLDFYESEGTLNVIAVTDAEADARAKLRRLLEITTEGPLHLEVAFRAWALQNAQAREVQARIDAQRMAYLVELCADVTGSRSQAESLAQLLYMIYIGSQQVIPPLDPDVVQRLYREALRPFDS
jgi:AcrR family transcriptional regulator